uniref:Uncharacterized protein n=1 Tax=Rhizophora mucronata TaxID=61149 RepID=A0A2P2ITJ5_RHIMU
MDSIPWSSNYNPFLSSARRFVTCHQ